MRLLLLAALPLSLCILAGPVIAAADPALAERFLATIAPPGAQITHGAIEASDGTLNIRGIVSHSQSTDGEEVIQRIGALSLQGLQALPNGLFQLDALRAENIHIDGAGDLEAAGSGSLRIKALTASNIEGGRIGALALSGAVISTRMAGSAYDVHIDKTNLRGVDTTALTRAAVNAHTGGQGARGENAILNALLNSNLYSGLNITGLRVQSGQSVLLTLSALGSEPDGNYAPFPASGNFFIRNARLDLRDARLAAIRQWLGQDTLQFDLESRHGFSAPARHKWNADLKLPPDAALSGSCAADNLNGFSPALIRQAQAASTSAASIRNCNLNFTGTEFVNRWLAQDGAKQGLSAEQARAKYLAGSLFVALDPQTAGDPLAMQLATAMQVFLSQPSRLNIRLDPPGGIKFTDALAAIAILSQSGSADAKSQAMQRLGFSISAVPLN